ncbi:MAG: hypothetical protein HFJ45_02565 [Clostridia bacterium]|nr:hypothetical protein [Clostridia bacterium]
MKAKKYDTETNSYIEVEAIGKVKYVGKSFGIEELTDGKEYYVTVIENGMLKIIDDSEEEYLYSITKPACLTDLSLCGKWEIVEDNKNKDLEKNMKGENNEV